MTLVSRTLALGGETFDLNESASLGAPRASGEIAWTLTVVDSAGLSGTASGTIDALPYAPPEIASLSAERYRAVVADDGTTSYVAANDGERVRFSLEASVCPVAAPKRVDAEGRPRRRGGHGAFRNRRRSHLAGRRPERRRLRRSRRRAPDV